MKRIVRHSGGKTRLGRSVDGGGDVDELLDRLVEANDAILERVGNVLDEAEGIRKPEDVVSVPTQVHQKPQLGFADSIDNSTARFVHKLRRKHHATTGGRPPGGVEIIDEGSSTSSWPADMQESSHPYQYELDHFEPPPHQLELGTVTEPLPLDATPMTYIDSVDQLRACVDDLNGVAEFAVDLEHHDYRSFLGLTCLMQISTRLRDYVIDPFPLWDELHILNEPFSNPDILKVLHGADSDVEWLQRDFGIYAVNMFDTGRAMRLLNYPKFGLHYLVQKHCRIELQKEYQRVDWRVRPIPEAYLDYAQKDTHYLLFCYDALRKELLERSNETGNLLRAVYTASRDLCLKCYEKPAFDANGYEKFVTVRKSFNNRQLFALRELWRWRDEKARALDESINYILPDHMLTQVAEVLPREMQGILACCNPVPSVVKKELIELHRIVLAARDRPLEAPVPFLRSASDGSSADSLRTVSADQTPWFKVPHDHSFSKCDEEIRPLHARVEELGGSVTEKRYGVLFGYREPAPSASFTSLNDWVSPYECYEVAVRERQRKMEEARKRKKVDEKGDHGGGDDGGVGVKKTKWSHRDKSSGVGVLQEPGAADNQQPAGQPSSADNICAPTATHILGLNTRQRPVDETMAGADVDQEMTLTKRAKKKQRKVDRGQSDVNEFPSNQLKPPPSGKPKGKWSDEGQHVLTPVDYSQYSSQMFNADPTTTDVYDPFGRSSSSGRGGRGRGGKGRGRGSSRRGGRGRAVSKTQSFRK